ncbi:glycoside hydrolase family 99-like domain-containing protein [Coraliomargarita sp. SDUM461004]|uniref:Glycoside hydrolase family 99-like domain-containing protein n=1 Tax=Thalassobacterium sedimentorum TaxID=3041258 RepID=A0ABU1AGY4_9BACT|nr:glycoside hydrolase family 99-like domain-containing protein [Coraliomargarita sp. SDUM461004]MDQ8193864.1 glycoside hydrolase family 99-like domain-containing protein [Coraliomargarita sp. SDUM461004]
MQRPEVAVYYFPNYHVDPRNERVHGAKWTEWELVKRATPRFPGHQQPKLPRDGFLDESDPEVMAGKIDLAADHGVDSFIFDWYWYNDGPYLERALEQGFLRAKNNHRLKFALMWANHDWLNIHPVRYTHSPLEAAPLLYPGAVTEETFEVVMDYCIENYFKHPSYWLIDGCPYFSIYALDRLIVGLGGRESTRHFLARFREKVQATGFPDLHLNAVVYTCAILPGENALLDTAAAVEFLGFDTVTSYVWIHHYEGSEFPQVDYEVVLKAYLDYWDQVEKKCPLPYYPNATMGWDASARTIQSDRYENLGYPFMYILGENTPKRFAKALSQIKDRLQHRELPHPFVTINAWNEWTEGSYLEPDQLNGIAYLEAIRSVFDTK